MSTICESPKVRQHLIHRQAKEIVATLDKKKRTRRLPFDELVRLREAQRLVSQPLPALTASERMQLERHLRAEHPPSRERPPQVRATTIAGRKKRKKNKRRKFKASIRTTSLRDDRRRSRSGSRSRSGKAQPVRVTSVVSGGLPGLGRR